MRIVHMHATLLSSFFSSLGTAIRREESEPSARPDHVMIVQGVIKLLLSVHHHSTGQFMVHIHSFCP